MGGSVISGKVITIAQQKGGAGKSTVAAHLAVAWARSRKLVAVVDIDPQASLSTWFERRLERFGEDEVDIEWYDFSGWRTGREVQKVASENDIVIIDTPPHAETEARIAVRAADLVVIPTQPSPLDVWATLPTVELAAREKSPALLVLNRVPPRANLTAQMITRLGSFPIRVARNTLGNRIAFADSMAGGRTALESRPSSVAAKEVRALARELFRKV